MIKFQRECHTLNRKGHTTRWWHRLWCRECRDAQEIDAMIGFGLMQIQHAPASINGLEETLFALDLSGGGKAVKRAARHVGIYKLFIAGRMGAGALVIMLVWWQYMNYIPPMHIPPKQLPTPNAFTYFKEAALKSLYGNEIVLAIALPQKDAKPTPRIDKTVTQKDVYGKDVIDEKGNVVRIKHIFDDEHLYTLADKQLLLDENRETLAALRQGLSYDYVEPHERTSLDIYRYYGQFRSMTRLLSLEAAVREAKGNWNGAMQSHLDAIQLGVKIAHGAPLMGELTGINCQTIGRHGIWNCLPHLNAAETRAAVTRMETIQAHQAPYAETLREEEWMSLETMRKEMRDGRWRFEIGNTDSEHKYNWFSLIFLGWSNRTILNGMQVYMDKLVARSRLSYQQERALTPLALPQDPLSQMLLPIFSGGRFKETSSEETQNALLLTTLALHAYALEHAGQYPSTLQALTPDYIKRVPVDPFAPDNAPLRYRNYQRTDYCEDLFPSSYPKYPGRENYVLYSVGPDGKDDGGQPTDLMTEKHNVLGANAQAPRPGDNNRYLVYPESTGDIVAGLNKN